MKEIIKSMVEINEINKQRKSRKPKVVFQKDQKDGQTFTYTDFERDLNN